MPQLRVSPTGFLACALPGVRIADDPSASFDFDLPVGDCAGNLTLGPDEEQLSYDELALETPTHLHVFRADLAFQKTRLGDVDVLALFQLRFHAALNHK